MSQLVYNDYGCSAMTSLSYAVQVGAYTPYIDQTVSLDGQQRQLQTTINILLAPGFADSYPSDAAICKDCSYSYTGYLYVFASWEPAGCYTNQFKQIRAPQKFIDKCIGRLGITKAYRDWYTQDLSYGCTLICVPEQLTQQQYADFYGGLVKQYTSDQIPDQHRHHPAKYIVDKAYTQLQVTKVFPVPVNPKVPEIPQSCPIFPRSVYAVRSVQWSSYYCKWSDAVSYDIEHSLKNYSDQPVCTAYNDKNCCTKATSRIRLGYYTKMPFIGGFFDNQYFTRVTDFESLNWKTLQQTEQCACQPKSQVVYYTTRRVKKSSAYGCQPSDAQTFYSQLYRAATDPKSYIEDASVLIKGDKFNFYSGFFYILAQDSSGYGAFAQPLFVSCTNAQMKDMLSLYNPAKFNQIKDHTDEQLTDYFRKTQLPVLFDVASMNQSIVQRLLTALKQYCWTQALYIRSFNKTLIAQGSQLLYKKQMDNKYLYSETPQEWSWPLITDSWITSQGCLKCKHWYVYKQSKAQLTVDTSNVIYTADDNAFGGKRIDLIKVVQLSKDVICMSDKELPCVPTGINYQQGSRYVIIQTKATEDTAGQVLYNDYGPYPVNNSQLQQKLINKEAVFVNRQLVFQVDAPSTGVFQEIKEKAKTAQIKFPNVEGWGISTDYYKAPVLKLQVLMMDDLPTTYASLCVGKYNSLGYFTDYKVYGPVLRSPQADDKKVTELSYTLKDTNINGAYRGGIVANKYCYNKNNNLVGGYNNPGDFDPNSQGNKKNKIWGRVQIYPWCQVVYPSYISCAQIISRLSQVQKTFSGIQFQIPKSKPTSYAACGSGLYYPQDPKRSITSTVWQLDKKYSRQLIAFCEDI